MGEMRDRENRARVENEGRTRDRGGGKEETKHMATGGGRGGDDATRSVAGGGPTLVAGA
ncbi:hypothetical protein [Oryza sativa Japonica Group]|uniref:Uncharacterized protein n=1 Tax=Oryza sativa subsp. japonica TaxID=39947 RepID=Q9LGD9_ORYSJ|nr:hypothetical protein [Oryza sativa Japonica Group]